MNDNSALRAQPFRRFWRTFWIDASSSETLELGLKSIAHDPEAKAVGVGTSARSVLSWLSTVESNALLIYDNADRRPEDIEPYIPTGAGCNVLLTSRNPSMAQFISHKEAVVEVVDMDDNDATSLLLKWVTRGQPSEEVKQSAISIVKKLYCLPLAVDQAGAAIHSGLCTIDDYLTVYSSRRKDLMSHPSFKGASSYGRAVYTTWDLSYRVILAAISGSCSFMTSAAAESAILIIEFFAFFHYDHISEEIIKRASESPRIFPWSSGQRRIGSSVSNDFLQRLTLRLLPLDHHGKWDPFPFREGIQILNSFSLIKTDSHGYSVHPLVHSWSRDRMTDEGRKLRSRAASALLAHSITWNLLGADFAFRRKLIPHMKSCNRHSAEVVNSEHYTEEELANFGLAYHENGYYEEAEKLRVRAVEMSNRILGKEHPDTLKSMDNLASTYSKQGNYKGAETLAESVMKLRKEILGKKHPDTLESMNSLAATYSEQGRYGEAEKLKVQVLELRKKILGWEHPGTLESMNALAVTYAEQGRYHEAEKLAENVLTLRAKVLGGEHPDVLDSMNGLAATYFEHGRYKEAERLYVHVLELGKKVLGRKHPARLESMNGLAATYLGQERHNEAEKLYLRVLESRRKVLGREHPRTLESMHGLATTYLQQGRHQEAESLLVQAFESIKNVLGKEHPHALGSLHDLAAAYSEQGRAQEAEKLITQVFESVKKVLGEEHPNTLMCMANLAIARDDLGQTDNAIELMQQAVDLYGKILGPDHANTVHCKERLEELKDSEQSGESSPEARPIWISSADPRQLFSGPLYNHSYHFGYPGYSYPHIPPIYASNLPHHPTSYTHYPNYPPNYPGPPIFYQH